jgi:hypothetical protein
MKKQAMLQTTYKKALLIAVLFLLSAGYIMAQVDTLAGIKPVLAQDTLGLKPDPPKDSMAKRHSPRTAALRSAILPGLGQIYNKKYWKLPIIYAALGITGYIFVDNLGTYREYRFAYAARVKAADPVSPDSTDYHTLKSIYKRVQPESIRVARNRFRQYIDYSALFFVLFWGLNVVDATVDGHLKLFDVSPDLSLHLRPGPSQMAGTNGLSLVLGFKNTPSKERLLPSKF